MKLRWKKGTAGEQRGAFIVFTALTLWFLMMFVAFSVDFGNYYQHRSRLQNAADAAALAGVAKYTEEEIAANSAGAVAAPTLSKGRLVTLVENDKAVSASRTVRSQAQDYVTNNYGNLDIKDNKVWSEEVTEEKTENGVTQSTTTTHRYCRVDLVDTIPTFFARIFGVDSLTVKVSALALMDGSAAQQKLDLEQIAKNLSEFAPNVGWETIHYSNRNHTLDGQKIDPLSADEKAKNRNVITDFIRQRLGTDFQDTVYGARYDGTGYIVGYGEPWNGEGVGQPIYLANEANLAEANTQVTTEIFNFNSSLSKYSDYDIFALFVDRDNITPGKDATQHKKTGCYERFTTLNIGSTVAAKQGNVEVPFYVRIESEPSNVASNERGLTTVCRIDINLDKNNLDDASVTMNQKPVVIVYEGPQQNRGDYDAPWISNQHTAKGAVVSNYEMKAGQIQNEIEPLLKKFNNNRESVPKSMVQNCITTSAPVVITIPDGYTFNGSIYMPRSKVIINGKGSINGFIFARKIEQEAEGNPNRKRLYYHDISLSTVSLVSINKLSSSEKEMVFETDTITGDFEMVYSNYVDYSDKKYLTLAGFAK